ncbi:hypothetical protein K440DRAFT_614420 [Wilcoxina mikolae CBS 423.85]|nr:hypothetical protein K440DRAFT_614420 [Wilcoxina mikolae CBS 423.85]
MVLLSERHHGPSRNTGIRASIDGYAAALSSRKRTSVAATLAPLSPSKSAEPRLNCGGGNSSTNDSSPKQSRNIMSSFFSRFGSKNKSKLTVNVESPPKPSYSRNNSVPNSPLTPGKQNLSIPIVDPLPSPSAFKTLEQFPLCVAYVQAIKTSSLPACTLSSEKILRQEVARGKALGTASKRGRTLHRHHISTKSADLDWTKKLFVLVPGILLQYSGDGMDDRLPEKVLELTATSLAFASDAIPGRPWVLQVYRSAGVDGGFLPERKNAFIAKVTFRGGMRNSASALLLVFECAEEMDSWMVILRAEATRLGGGVKRKASPKPANRGELEDSDPGDSEDWKKDVYGDDRKESDKEAEPDLNSRFSRRIVINRDDHSKNEWSSSDENASKRASTQYRNSTDGDRSIISNDQIILDGLREPSRLSLHSGGDKTRIVTISPDTSPERYSTKNNTTYKRSSLQLSPRSRSSVELRPQTQALSAIGKDGYLYWIPSSRTPSPPINNFTVPRRQSSMPPLPPAASSPRASYLGLTTVNSSEELETPRRPRPVSTQASPATSPHLTSSKSRPISMADYYTTHRTPKSSNELLLCSAPDPATLRRTALPLPPLPGASPIRTRSLRRRSLSALSISESQLARNSPGSPPSMPLPKVPSPVAENMSMGLSQSMPRSSGGNWAAMEKRRERRRSSRHNQENRGLGISIPTSEIVL